MAIAVYGRYECHELLGQGGFGRVYRALDTLLEREVALKVVDVPQQGALLAPYLVEPRLLARLRHPHIVDIHGAEHRQAEGLLLIDLEWMDSGSVGARLRERNWQPLPVDEAVRIAAATLLALAHVHQAGVLHRDVRAENVLLGSGGRTIKLGDFGEAEVLHAPSPPGGALRAPMARRRKTPSAAPAAAPLVATGVAGSYPYMAPECFDPNPQVDPRADIWAAGVLLYEMLDGRRPFDIPVALHNDRAAWREAILSPVPPLADIHPHVSSALSETVARAMAKAREERFGSAGEMLERLRDIAVKGSA